MSTPPTDAEDWHSALAGEAEAFARVFDRHQNRIFRHSLELVPTRDDAKDIVGITFLEAWRKRESVRLVDGSLLPWLLVTATYSARNVSRSARRYRDLLERVPRAELAITPEFDEGPAVAAMTHLSIPHREVVTLCIIEGLSEKKAADVLAVPIGTVKSRLYRAKQNLADRLAPSSKELRTAL